MKKVKNSWFLLLGVLFGILIVKGVNADPIDTMEDNLKMGMAEIVLLITVCCIIIITAFDARVAVIVGFLLFMSEFILFYEATQQGITGWDPFKVGAATVGCVVVMALMLLVTYKKSTTYLR